MKTIFVVVIGLALFGCTSVPKTLDESYTAPEGSSGIDLSKFPRVRKWIMNRAVTEKEKNYYGADLTQFPLVVREWVMDSAFTENGTIISGMVNPELRVWWDDDNTVRYELTYTKGNSTFKGGSTFGRRGYSVSPTTFRGFKRGEGEYARFQTLRYEWELSQQVENLLENDSVFAEIIEFAMQLSEEIEYDWANFNAYKGPVRQSPNVRHAVCAGYANEVTEKIFALPSVKAVQRWTSPDHAWNIIKLVDGRTLYFDLTWFDNEHINEETGEIYQTDDYGWANITFDEKLFRYSNVGYSNRVFHHAIGEFENEITR